MDFLLFHLDKSLRFRRVWDLLYTPISSADAEHNLELRLRENAALQPVHDWQDPVEQPAAPETQHPPGDEQRAPEDASSFMARTHRRHRSMPNLPLRLPRLHDPA